MMHGTMCLKKKRSKYV